MKIQPVLHEKTNQETLTLLKEKILKETLETNLSLEKAELYLKTFNSIPLESKTDLMTAQELFTHLKMKKKTEFHQIKNPTNEDKMTYRSCMKRFNKKLRKIKKQLGKTPLDG
ncbi:hypothetical protein N9Y92_02570 [Chlamydiales bacterium]|nr:hypothetical protein [Chlamydiales bacterium]